MGNPSLEKRACKLCVIHCGDKEGALDPWCTVWCHHTHSAGFPFCYQCVLPPEGSMVPMPDHKTNGEVLHKMKTKRSLLNTIKKRKCQYFGYIIRGNGVQRLLMEGRINGGRGRGRPRTMWTDNIKEWTKISYNDCIRVAQDRERWRSMTADLLTTDGT